MTERKNPFDFTPEAEALRAITGIKVDPKNLHVLTNNLLQFEEGQRFAMDPDSREQFLVIAERHGISLKGSTRSVRPTDLHTGSHVVQLLLDGQSNPGLRAEVHSFGSPVERRARAVRAAVELILEMLNNPEIGYECNGRREELRRSTPSS